MTTNDLLTTGGVSGVAARPEAQSSAVGVVQLLDGDKRHLEVRYYDVPEKCRRWSLPRDCAQDLVSWWIKERFAQTPRGVSTPEQRFGRIFVSLVSHTQVYLRGSDLLGRPNITGYQFPRAVMEALAAHLSQRS